MDRKWHLLRRGDRVLDLGYYPGSWTQYASRIVGGEGLVVGVDLQQDRGKLSHLSNIRTYQKDLFEMDSLEGFHQEHPFDVVLSDMAPSTTGIKMVDQSRSLELLERVFCLLPFLLRGEGNLVLKVFDGPQVQELIRSMEGTFDSMRRARPQSTRSISKEFFVIGRGFRV